MTIPVLVVSGARGGVQELDLRNEDTGGGKDWSVWRVTSVGVDGNDGGEDTRDSVRGGGDGVSGSTSRGGEDFRGVSVKDTVEGVLEEGGDTGQGVNLNVCLGLSQAEQHDTGTGGEESHGELSATSTPLDERGSGDRTGNTTGSLVCVSGVCVVQTLGCAGSSLGKFSVQIRSEESVVQRVSETDSGVTEHDERCGPCQATR